MRAVHLAWHVTANVFKVHPLVDLPRAKDGQLCPLARRVKLIGLRLIYLAPIPAVVQWLALTLSAVPVLVPAWL